MSPRPSATTDAPAEPGRPSRIWLPLAALALAAWFAFLVVLAVRTANPVTVDRQQLIDSRVVVVATPGKSSARGVTLKVERVLAGSGVPDSLVAETKEPKRFAGGGRFIVPLRKTADGGFVVTQAPQGLNYAQLVYPATDDALRATETILATETPDPYR